MNEFLLIIKLITLIACVKAVRLPERNTSEILRNRLSCEMLTTSPHCVKLGSKFYIIDPNRKVNWHEADRSCMRQNARLAVIENDADMDAITEYLAQKIQYNDAGYRQYWLGANDLGAEGSFHEIKSGRPLRYSRWGPNQPDNRDGTENCMTLLWFDQLKKYLMNDGNCLYVTSYICELNINDFDEINFEKRNQCEVRRLPSGNLQITIEDDRHL